MRGMVVPSTPCCPSTSAAALSSLRRDSRLRACWGARVRALDMIGLPSGKVRKIVLDINVNVNLHLQITEESPMSSASTAVASAQVVAAAPSTSHPLRNRNFLTWWIGATLSLMGDQFYIVALPWIVLQLTGSGLAMGT